MKIEAGKYYRTRGGQVFGPMVPNEFPASDYVWCLDPLNRGHSWDSEGIWRKGWDGPFDLISEVYVSDTPPAVKETEEELREMMRDPRYWQKREPEWVKRVTDGFRVLVGGDTPPAAPEAKSLRDEFAMAVVSGVYIHWRTSLDKTDSGVDFLDIAEMAYGIADAMMEARKK
jgi:hypothetical protein